MKKLQMLAVLFFAMGATNLFASENYYSKPNNARASKTVRNTLEQPRAKEQYLKAAQAPKFDRPKATKESK